MPKMDGALPYGYYLPEDLQIMAKHISAIIPRSPMVEIGCCYGRSSAVLAKRAKECETTLFCIDPFYGGEEPPSDEKIAFNFVENMLLLGFYESIRILPMTSQLAAKLPLLSRISVLHLDGSHIPENIAADIRNFAERVEELIILHDTDREDVRLATRLLPENYELIVRGVQMDIWRKNRRLCQARERS